MLLHIIRAISAESKKRVEERRVKNFEMFRGDESIAKDQKSSSPDTLKEVTKGVSDIDKVVVETLLCLSQEEDVLENVELRKLVFEYFDVSDETLNFLSEVENYLTVLGFGDFYLTTAIKKYEQKEFDKCRHWLEKFIANENPFQEKFYSMFEKIHVRQKALLHKAENTFDEMNKKRQEQEKATAAKQEKATAAKSSFWEKTGRILHFIAASAAAVTEIFVQLISIFWHAGVAAVVAGLVALFAEGGALIFDIKASKVKAEAEKAKKEAEFFGKIAEKLKSEENISKEILGTTTSVIEELNWIKRFANALEKKIESIGKYAAEGVKEEDVIEVLIPRVKSLTQRFKEDIDQLTTHTRKCMTLIDTGRDKVLNLVDTGRDKTHRFKEDIDQLTTHTRQCMTLIDTGRDKVLNLVDTGRDKTQRFKEDIDQLTTHTRKCMTLIDTGRDKVLNLVDTGRDKVLKEENIILKDVHILFLKHKLQARTRF